MEEKKVADFSGRTREGVRIKVKDAKSGKIIRKYKYQEKISDSGKEAKEAYDVDIAQNKYSHYVDEQGTNGNWKRKHNENEPLTTHNKKKQSKKNRITQSFL